MDKFVELQNKIETAKYVIPKEAINNGLEYSEIAESLEYKLNCIYFFNTQLIGYAYQVEDLLKKQAPRTSPNSEVILKVNINPIIYAIQFDSLILHSTSLLDISSRLIKLFYPRVEYRTFRALKKSLTKDYAGTMMAELIEKHWVEWIEIIYNYRVEIFHKYYAKPGQEFKIKVDSLNQIKVEYFELPSELKARLKNPVSTDVISFSKELVALTEKFLQDIIITILHERLHGKIFVE